MSLDRSLESAALELGIVIDHLKDAEDLHTPGILGSEITSLRSLFENELTRLRRIAVAAEYIGRKDPS